MAKNENSNFSYMTRRIGGTTYKVKVVFSDTEKETMEDFQTYSSTNSMMSSIVQFNAMQIFPKTSVVTLSP